MLAVQVAQGATELVERDTDRLLRALAENLQGRLVYKGSTLVSWPGGLGVSLGPVSSMLAVEIFHRSANLFKRNPNWSCSRHRVVGTPLLGGEKIS